MANNKLAILMERGEIEAETVEILKRIGITEIDFADIDKAGNIKRVLDMNPDNVIIVMSDYIPDSVKEVFELDGFYTFNMRKLKETAIMFGHIKTTFNIK